MLLPYCSGSLNRHIWKNQSWYFIVWVTAARNYQCEKSGIVATLDGTNDLLFVLRKQE
jgi:hypothetical protein